MHEHTDRCLFLSETIKIRCNRLMFNNFSLYLQLRMTKGRNKELIEKRDEKLCRRYYYWTERERLRFDDALRILSEQEFFISEERIMQIIRRKCRELKDLAAAPKPKIRKPKLTVRQLELFK